MRVRKLTNKREQIYKLSDENLWFRVSVLKTLSINIQTLKRTISSKSVVVSSIGKNSVEFDFERNRAKNECF